MLYVIDSDWDRKQVQQPLDGFSQSLLFMLLSNQTLSKMHFQFCFALKKLIRFSTVIWSNESANRDQHKRTTDRLNKPHSTTLRAQLNGVALLASRASHTQVNELLASAHTHSHAGSLALPHRAGDRAKCLCATIITAAGKVLATFDAYHNKCKKSES